jgi:hypothetical protein
MFIINMGYRRIPLVWSFCWSNCFNMGNNNRVEVGGSMENKYTEVFCLSCYGRQTQIYVGKFTIGNQTFNKYVCCMCGHENKEDVKTDGDNRQNQGKNMQ